MGKVLSGPASMFGIGQKDDPTYNPQVNQANAYNNFANNSDQEYNSEYTNAESALMNRPTTQGLFGAGGLNDRLGTEEKDLASTGYGLQGADREAYGQAAGDISRQFGQQEQDASKALARRGLGGGASGAAGATFSGLAGNKNEMLAKAQTDIAQKRMADTTQRLQATRNQMQSLGMAGNQAIQSGANDRYNAKSASLGKAAGIESGVNDQGRQANEDAIGHKSKNIGDAWAEGKYSGTKSGEADATSSWMKMGGSSSMGMSDENNKQNIGDGGAKARGFLSQVANSHDYGYMPAKEKSKDSTSQQSGGAKPPWASMIQQPNKDGTYTPSATESANHDRAFSGLSGGGGATEDSGLTSLFGGGSGGSPELMSMFSDEDNKEHVGDGSDQIRGFLDSVQPHSYDYKDEYKENPLAGDGEYVTPMAQELEQTELGKDMVHDTPDGKVVDYGKGFGTLLAGMADVNKRLSAIEGRKK